MQFTSAQNKRSILSLHYCVLQGGTNEFPQCCATTGAGHTLAIHGWVSKIKNIFHHNSNAQRHMFRQIHMWGLHFQCAKNCFDHKYCLPLPKIISLILLCTAKTERVKKLTHLSFTSKCNIFIKGISELPQPLTIWGKLIDSTGEDRFNGLHSSILLQEDLSISTLSRAQLGFSENRLTCTLLKRKRKKGFFYGKSYLLASMVPWRSFNIHGTFVRKCVLDYCKCASH